jgi:hypothetical protein
MRDGGMVESLCLRDAAFPELFRKNAFPELPCRKTKKFSITILFAEDF